MITNQFKNSHRCYTGRIQSTDIDIGGGGLQRCWVGKSLDTVLLNGKLLYIAVYNYLYHSAFRLVYTNIYIH